MPIQEQVGQERRDAIINYITENDGCTKAQVIDYMKGRSAVVTTHKIIIKLIEGGTVIVEPDKKNRQIHHLTINNKFKSISEELDRTEELMDSMGQPIRMSLKHEYEDPPASNEKELLQQLEDRSEKPTNFTDIYDHLIYPYEESVFMILRILLARVSTISSEKDAQSLSTRIVNLMNRLTRQIHGLPNERRYLRFCVRELKTFQLSTTKTFAKKNRIDIGKRKDIIKYIQDFEKNWLTTTPTATN